MSPLAVSAARVCLAAFGLAVLSSAAASAAKPDVVPDWVHAAAAESLIPVSAEADAVVLMDDTVYTVAPNGTAVEHRRRVVKILKPQGRNDAVVFVPFSDDSKLLNLHVWSIGPDGREFALKDAEIIETGFPGQGNFYEDLRAKVAEAPGRDPGGVVAYEYNQRVRPYLTEANWQFQSGLPELNESFTLELPPGFTYGVVWAHHDAVKVVELEHQRWRWDVRETPPIDLRHVALSPAEGALAGRMTLHYTAPGVPQSTDGTWKGIGEWYQTLAHDRVQASPDLAAKARELAAGHTEFFDKVDAIATWVQTEIRYFAIERGIGGQQPHFAADVFRNRYGDCKDKATLLSAMLSAVDVHAALLMVDTERGVVDPDAPSTWGNHMIAAVELPAGYDSPGLHSVVKSRSGERYVIFDPTQPRVPFGQLPHYLQGSYGLLMEGAASQILALPVETPELNTLRRSAKFVLASDGAIKGTVQESRYGDLAIRRRALYMGGDAKQQTDDLDHTLGHDFTQFNVTGVKVTNAAALHKDLTLEYDLEVGHFARPMGPLLMLRPRVLGRDDLEADRRTRHVPVDLGETMQISDDYQIELPPGYTVDEVPDPVKIDVGFAAYESSCHVVEHALHYTRTYTVRQVTLPADRYDDVQRLAGVIDADEQSQAVLKKL